MHIEKGIVYTVVYEVDGILTVANFSQLGFAQRFANEVSGKIFTETVNRHATDDELNPYYSIVSKVSEDDTIIKPIDIPKEDYGKIIQELKESLHRMVYFVDEE